MLHNLGSIDPPYADWRALDEDGDMVLESFGWIVKECACA